jgi:hypothetical protein
MKRLTLIAWWSSWTPRRWLRGILLYLLLIGCGALLVVLKDIRCQPGYFGKALKSKDSLLVRIREPLQERRRSQKTIATVMAVVRNGKAMPVKGNVLLYFQQDSTVAALLRERKRPNREVRQWRGRGSHCETDESIPRRC